MSTKKAARDRESYVAAIRRGDHQGCLFIELQYGLAGYSPQTVLVGLDAITEGNDPHVAIEKHFLGGLA